MSWSLNVPATPRAEFYAALDHADLTYRQTDGDGQDVPGLVEAVEAAKNAAKTLAPLIRRDYVTGSLNGHIVQPTEGENYSDSVTVSLYGVSSPG